MCKLNPKIDLVFKKVFGTEQNKNVLRSLINSILPQDEQVVDLVIKNPYNEIDFLGDKLSVVDIKATDQTGRWYKIRVQFKGQDRQGQRDLPRGLELDERDPDHDYEGPRKAIIISLLDFDQFPEDSRYFRQFGYMDFDTGEQHSELDFLNLYFVELRKFDRGPGGFTTPLERWITFLNRASEFDRDSIPDELRDPDILQALHALETLSLSASEREYCESAQKALRDR